jgi:hypothetical protein
MSVESNLCQIRFAAMREFHRRGVASGIRQDKNAATEMGHHPASRRRRGTNFEPAALIGTPPLVALRRTICQSAIRAELLAC